MNKKQKEEIRQQVVIGIFQWLGYIILGVVTIGLLSLPFLGVYYAGKNNGYQEGVNVVFNDIWERYGDKYQSSITFKLADGRQAKFYKEQCPNFCNWEASGNIFSNPSAINFGLEKNSDYTEGEKDE